VVACPQLWVALAQHKEPKGDANNVMLLTLLAATSSVTFLISAVLAARHANAPLGDYVVAIVIGLLLAACNAWMVYKAGGILADLTKSWSQSRQEWAGRAFFLVMLLWIPFAAFFGDWVTLAAIRLGI
jgi:hypothetical protein